MANPELRMRGQIRAYLAVLLFLAVLLGSAAASVLGPTRRAAAQQALREELAAIVVARQARIVDLQPRVAHACQLDDARELARLLVLDGRWRDARWAADAYEARCGADAIVRQWGDAPVPPLRVRI